MKRDKLAILKSLFEESLQDKNEIDGRIKKNLDRIAEIDSFLDAIINSEDSDFKVFSPRSAENIYKEKIEEIKAEKRNLENENSSYYCKLTKIEKQIENLSLLIKEDKNNVNNMHLTILDIQEKERIRIARELHDSSLQNLAHLVHTLELSSLFVDQDPIRAKLELASCSQSIKQIINEIRDTIFNLRPMSFDDLGFKQCIENFVDTLKQQFKNYKIVFDVDDISIDMVDIEHKDSLDLFLVTIYRVIQEAMLNALKHSDGNKIELLVKRNNKELLLEIIDNGKGFLPDEIVNPSLNINKDTDKKHFGISIMQERIYLLGGKFKINSVPEQGTKILITVPLP